MWSFGNTRGIFQSFILIRRAQSPVIFQPGLFFTELRGALTTQVTCCWLTSGPCWGITLEPIQTQEHTFFVPARARKGALSYRWELRAVLWVCYEYKYPPNRFGFCNFFPFIFWGIFFFLGSINNSSCYNYLCVYFLCGLGFSCVRVPIWLCFFQVVDIAVWMHMLLLCCFVVVFCFLQCTFLEEN